MTTYPDDEDGAVLADLAAHGIDMTQPLQIEFAIDAPDEAASIAIDKAISKAGYDSEVVFDEGEPDEDDGIDPDEEEFGPSWTVYAKVEMVPQYEEIIRIQTELNHLADPHEGTCDGWGVMLAE